MDGDSGLLSRLLLEYGYSATESPGTLAAILSQARVTRLSEQPLAEVLLTCMDTLEGHIPTLPPENPGMREWSPSVIAAVAFETTNRDIQLPVLVKCLDRPGFFLKDGKAFLFFVSVLQNLCQKTQAPFPMPALLAPWTNNKAGQLSFLKWLVAWDQSVQELFGPAFVGRRALLPSDPNRALATLLLPSVWNFVDVLERLLDLASNSKDLEESVRDLLVLASQTQPEALLLSFSKLSWNTAPCKDVLNALLIPFLQGHSNSSLVLPSIWQNSPSLLVAGCLVLYNTDPTILSRILDLSQEIKILPQILETKPFNFAIDLAALASRREYLNLEKWLQDHIRSEGAPFIFSCLEFLRDKVAFKLGRSDGAPQSVPLSAEVAAMFLRIVFSQNETLPADKLPLLREILGACLQAYPQLESIIPSLEESISQSPGFTQDIEEEANSYYERIYKGDLGIPQIVDILSRFKASADSREQQIFKCMIHNLFDEYQFFPRYPDKELAITSVLFGSLIQNQIISSMALGVALRYVLEALRQPVGSKLFNFASQALYQFQSRLPEWPQYCALLVQIPHLHQALPDVMQQIARLLKQADSMTEVKGDPMMLAQVSGQSSELQGAPSSAPFFSALKVDQNSTTLEKEPPVPSEAVRDKILFIINNISVDNLGSKVDEMAGSLTPQYHAWFSRYIVKRTSLEPNFHGLYSDFVDSTHSKELEKHIIHETFIHVAGLLNSEKTIASSQERTLLKNLGTWLGIMTLAKNKPIKHKLLAIKELLLEGYDSSRLIVVIPFVCKVLEQVHASIVFAPPNPWIMSIMKLLAELYHYANLKLNLKFEIEVLCKKLQLDIKDIPPTDILRNRPLKEYPSRTTDADALTQDSNGPLYSNIAAFITFNPNIPLFTTQPALKRIVHIAIDRAIREVIMSPVVERSVTIASITSREMVSKDFALEGSDEKMRKAAHLMAQSLAGNLAAVSTREPLRVSMIAHLKSLLLQNGFSDQAVPEQIVFVIVSDNLDLACSVMEKTAAEKSITEIDESLSGAYLSRRKHRERSTQPFYDMTVFGASRYPSLLPESLRLRVGGLSLQQMRVYEDFISRAISPSTESERVLRQQRLEPPRDLANGYGQVEPTYDNAPAVLTTQQAIEKFNNLLLELDRSISQNGNTTLASLPVNHIVRALIRQVPILVTQAANRDDCALLFSKRIIQQLYGNDDKLSREIYLLVLERLCEISKRFFKELKDWLLYDNDERTFDVPIAIALLERGFISVQEVDLQMARLAGSGQSSAIAFVCRLIQACLLSDPPLCSFSAFLLSIETLERISSEPNVKETVESVKTGFGRKIASLAEKETSIASEDVSKIKDQIIAVYKEWIQIHGHPATSLRSQLNYVSLLQEKGLLQCKNLTPLFFRVALEVTVDAYNQSASGGAANGAPYQTIDSLARLFVLFIVHQPDLPNGEANSGRKAILVQILSVITLVMVHSHEQNRTDFSQKPFFRLFSSMLHGFETQKEQLESMYPYVMICFGNIFHTLSPVALPGFTFSWVQLVSHRYFMPKLLKGENQKFWPLFQRLLVDLLSFLKPYLKQVVLSNTTRLLYKATLRLMLVLLHDFPEFLCDYHLSLVDAIPHTCVQLRNLILSAFPQNMRLPDPFTPNLKVDLLPEINEAPTVLSDYTTALVATEIKPDLDSYLVTRAPLSFLGQLHNRLLLPPNSPDGKYNITAINALVLYVGIQAIIETQSKQSQGSAPITHSAPMDIFHQLVVDLDNEGRYHLFNAIANQLRYPNSHTHYFSCVLLFLFSEANQDKIQEQITRVLIERLIVNRPHPYGLLITFIELIRNPRYNFWELNIIRCAPEIERLFSNVAKSIVSRGG